MRKKEFEIRVKITLTENWGGGVTSREELRKAVEEAVEENLFQFSTEDEFKVRVL